jgi:neurotransmitter:Na+ symporter, NSS family
MSHSQQSEVWSSRLGVILAVAGSAVGLGNFLRFPGLAAQYGSGAFMIAYFCSLILLGIPICWAEWTLGRYAGQKGFRSSPGIFHALIRHPVGKYLGVIGVIIPVTIYMYYVYVEAWCLGYAWYFITGKLNLGSDVEAYNAFWTQFVGAMSDGFIYSGGHGQVVPFVVIVFILNFFLIYRGLARGIEIFCTYAMPALIVLAVIVLVRVLTRSEYFERARFHVESTGCRAAVEKPPALAGRRRPDFLFVVGRFRRDHHLRQLFEEQR